MNRRALFHFSLHISVLRYETWVEICSDSLISSIRCQIDTLSKEIKDRQLSPLYSVLTGTIR